VDRPLGYRRVSTDEQRLSGLGLEAQSTVIRAAYPEIEIVTEVASGAKRDRPELNATLRRLREGEADGLVVAKLDRVARNTAYVLDIATAAATEGWDFVALDLGIDTTTTNGRLVLTIFAALGEWERNTIRDRIRVALAAKKARGEAVGRPRGRDPWMTERVRELAQRCPEGTSLRQIATWCAANGVTARSGHPLSAASVRRYLR
jgi:DNA invertase Pin-like site-specific DNA recombinase